MGFLHIKKFKELLHNERIIHIERRDKFIFFVKIFKAIFIFGIAFLIVYMTFIYKQQIISFLTTNLYWKFETIIIFLTFSYIILKTLMLYIDWKFDNLILTDQRLIYIDQHFIFGRDIESIHLKDIVNIHISNKGLLESILNYGKIIIQTGSAKTDDITIKHIKNPSNIVKMIQNEQTKLKQSNW